jgi:uncharacterized membrane protein
MTKENGISTWSARQWFIMLSLVTFVVYLKYEVYKWFYAIGNSIVPFDWWIIATIFWLGVISATLVWISKEIKEEQEGEEKFKEKMKLDAILAKVMTL